MDVILIPGFWLDASSWNEVTPALEAAGHRLHPVTPVPTTIVTCEYPAAQLTEWVDGGAPFVRELAAMRDLDYVDLPTGHWPQFTRPSELGRGLVDAIAR